MLHLKIRCLAVRFHGLVALARKSHLRGTLSGPARLGGKDRPRPSVRYVSS